MKKLFLIFSIVLFVLCSCEKNEPVSFTINTVSIPPDGGVVLIEPNFGSFQKGDTVLLSAKPNQGYLFDEWSQDLIGTERMGFIVMNSNKEVHANFITLRNYSIRELSGKSALTWTVAGGGSVTRDGRSETNIFANFEITFAANQNIMTYFTANGGDLFDGSGTWNFIGNDLSRISLTGNHPASNSDISIFISGDDLELIFTIPLPNSGRKITTHEASTPGNYRFRLKRKL